MFLKEWDKKIIDRHMETVKLLESIREEAYGYIRLEKAVSERGVQELIHKRYKDEGLISDGPQIVAFGPSCGVMHYFPNARKSRVLKNNMIVLIDLWARFKNGHSPYADLTWIGFNGDKISGELKKVCDIVFKARDVAVNFVRRELKKGVMPIGKEVDAACRKVIESAGYGKYFIHATGHSLGFVSPHGSRTRINTKYSGNLLPNLGYTIEPGIYLKDKFGVRSEIDFYMTHKKKMIVTCDVQKKVFRI